MAGALIIVAVVQGKRGLEPESVSAQGNASPQGDGKPTGLISSAVVAFGLIALIFGGYRSGFATATEISSFAVVYALVVGSLAFRETTWRSAGQVMRHAAVRSGMVLFIVAAAQSLAYVLTLQQIPHALAEIMVSLSSSHGTWLFLLLTVLILILMGSVLEGAAALIIFGPLLMPVARQLGIDPLHYGIILVIGMGIGLFAPPLGLGLYGSCLIGGVKLEETVRPILKYLGILFICLLIITFVPGISTLLPRAFGY
jgi:tripartite ATP-independent transporter DctM subunit